MSKKEPDESSVVVVVRKPVSWIEVCDSVSCKYQFETDGQLSVSRLIFVSGRYCSLKFPKSLVADSVKVILGILMLLSLTPIFDSIVVVLRRLVN